jgi:hypothetical protein
MLGTRSPLKNSGSHIDASLSRQPLVKGERLVRLEVNAVIECRRAQTIGCCFADSRQCLLGGLGSRFKPPGLGVWGWGVQKRSRNLLRNPSCQREPKPFAQPLVQEWRQNLLRNPSAEGSQNPLRNHSSKNGGKTFCTTPPPKGAKTLCATPRPRIEAKPSAQPLHRREQEMLAVARKLTAS